MTPTMVIRAGRYPLATWMIGIAGHPPEIAQPVPNNTAPGITCGVDASRGAADPQQSERAHEDHHSTREGEEHAQVLEGEHAVQLSEVAETDVGDGVTES